MDREERNDGLRELEETYSGYEVRDPDGEKIGKVDDLFVDERDVPEYIGVKMGLFGLSGTTLIPAEITTVDEAHEVVVVSAEKEKVKDGPSFESDQEITPELEREVHEYYGLESAEGIEREPYETYAETEPETAPVAERDEDDLEDRDELQVQRSEEELRAGTREREAGKVNVRKRVRTDREQIRVPKKREEVSVERVPVEEGTAAETEIGEDEVSVPVVEEEVVTEKRPVVKEELRVRKDVVEDEEVVEEDVRKEEVDVEDATERRNR